jgi:hypothetical protein
MEMIRRSEINSIIGKIDRETLFTAFSPLVQQIKYAEKLNHENLTYLSLEYQETPLLEGQSEEGDLLIRGLRNLCLPYDVYSGHALMEQVTFQMDIYHRKDPIFKIQDPEGGFSVEYRPDTLFGSKSAYVLFFKRDKNRQGNYFEFKKFIKQEISPLLFQEANYEYIFGKAIWSSNSEIRFSHKGDWRTKKRLWNGKEVTGLQYAYLLMGFRPLPSDPTGQLLVLPK